jgi:hypothetical protein
MTIDNKFCMAYAIHHGKAPIILQTVTEEIACAYRSEPKVGRIVFMSVAVLTIHDGTLLSLIYQNIFCHSEQ